MPARRPRELQPALGRHLAGAPASEQLPLQQVLLAAPACRGHDHPSPGQLVLEQTLEHTDRRVERRHGGTVLGPAVPAAVVELFGEQTRDEAVDVRPEVGADRERPAVDARLDLAVEERLAVVLPPAVRRDQGDRLACRRARGIQAEVAQQHQRGQGRGPGLAVGEVRLDAGPPVVDDAPREARAAVPLAVGIARGEQASRPAFLLDAGPLGRDLLGRRLDEVAQHLPADRRVTVEQPVRDLHGGDGRSPALDTASLSSGPGRGTGPDQPGRRGSVDDVVTAPAWDCRAEVTRVVRT